MAGSATAALWLDDTTSLRKVAVDGDGRICEDVLCTGCRYNLRGMARSGACPECGQAVAESLVRNDLRFADPAWVRSLARGAWILLLLLPLAVVAGLLAPFGVSILLVWLVAMAGLAWGVWAFTEPEPGEVSTSRARVARSMCRWTALALPVPAIIGMLMYTLAPSLPVLGAFSQLGLPSLLLWAAIVVLCAGFTMLVASAHATRLARPDVASSLRVMVYIVLGFVPLITIVGFGDETMMIVAAVAFAGSLFWSFLLLSVLAPALRLAANQAAARSLARGGEGSNIP